MAPQVLPSQRLPPSEAMMHKNELRFHCSLSNTTSNKIQRKENVLYIICLLNELLVGILVELKL